MGMRFSIGQEVWRASFETTPSSVECPDCGGTGRIRCIMHDDTMVSVECRACQSGYEPPSGRIKTYVRKPVVRQTVITGVEIKDDVAEWRTRDSYIVPDRDLFADEPSALARAAEKAREYDEEELRRIATKEKDTRSWAWNASYHRRCIKDAERQIEYHRAKLAVASVKAKEPA